MTTDVSGFGFLVTIVADTTFPAGFQFTQAADDADPLDMPSIQIGDTAMGVNGDMLFWAKANTLPVTLNVIPGSEDDQNLAILADANRVGQNKVSAYDNITITVVYPDGRQITLNNGKMVDAMFGNSIASQGRLKTKAYAFKFQNKTGV